MACFNLVYLKKKLDLFSLWDEKNWNDEVKNDVHACVSA